MLSAHDDHFYYWANEIPEDICNCIIKTGTDHDTFEARTLGGSEDSTEEEKCNVIFLLLYEIASKFKKGIDEFIFL